jgi:hypothetical protein
MAVLDRQGFEIADSSFRLSRRPFHFATTTTVFLVAQAQFTKPTLERVWIAQSEASPLNTPDPRGALFRSHSSQRGRGFKVTVPTGSSWKATSAPG